MGPRASSHLLPLCSLVSTLAGVSVLKGRISLRDQAFVQADREHLAQSLLIFCP